MTTRDAQIKANTKWAKKAYDFINVIIRKDAVYNRDFIRQHAESRGESMNAFFKRALKEFIRFH